jgi:hypothetical protein
MGVAAKISELETQDFEPLAPKPLFTYLCEGYRVSVRMILKTIDGV